MASIPQLSHEIRHLFEQSAAILARQTGLRQRRKRFAQLAYLHNFSLLFTTCY